MRRTLPLVLALLLGLVLAAPARADLLTDIYQDFIEDGRLDACKYKQTDLRKLKDLIPADQIAYQPDFIPALDDAIARRAEGACNKKRPDQQGVTPVAPPPPPTGVQPPPPPQTVTPGQTPQPAVPAPATQAVQEPPPTPGAQPAPAPETISAQPIVALAVDATDPGSQAPFPVLALAILLGLLALGGLLIGAVRWMAWEPAWAGRMRHATGEAGWRASCTWAEFTDFVRFGR